MTTIHRWVLLGFGNQHACLARLWEEDRRARDSWLHMVQAEQLTSMRKIWLT